MELKPIDAGRLPAVRSVRAKMTPEQISVAVEALNAGEPVSPDETFPNKGRARRAALRVREDLNALEFQNGLRPSTIVWQEDDGWHFAVILREGMK